MKQHLLKNSFLRGVLFLLLCVVGLGNAWGEEVTVTFDASTNELNWSVGGEQSGTKNGITLSTTDGAYNTNNKQYRIYKGATFTIECSNGNITQIDITCSANGTSQYGPGNFTSPTSEAYSYEGKIGTWTGSAPTVILTASGSQVRMTTITVTYVVDTSITYSIIDRHDSGTNREYYVGDTPTADGLALIDNSEQEITEGVTWSFEPQTIQEETKSVTASAEYQGVKRAEYTYNITNKGTRTLSSIEIGGTPSKTSYHIGDTPSAEGLTVNAVYSNGSKADVTDDVTWTFNPETIAEGTKQVTATAIYKELTATYNFRITKQDFPPIYELIPIEGKDNAYAGTESITINGVTWSVTGNSTMVPWRIGGKSLDKVDRDIKCSTPINGTFGKVVVSIGTTSSSITLHSLTLSVADNPDFTNATKYKHTSNLKANTKHAFDITPATNAYYKITFNVTVTGTSNKYYQFSGAKFYRTDNVEISSAGLATFCLPYNATIPDGLTAYTATDKDNGESVKLTAKEGGKIAAGEGVVLKGDEGTYTFVAAEGSVSATEGNQMVGVTEDTPLTSADNAYMLTRKKDDGSIALRLLATDYTLGANKAYLKLENNARNLISVVWDDNATGIYDLSEKEEAENGAIYNLAGQKLMRTQKGINIINGKLVIK